MQEERRNQRTAGVTKPKNGAGVTTNVKPAASAGRALAVFAAIAAGSLLADQITKNMVFDALGRHDLAR